MWIIKITTKFWISREFLELFYFLVLIFSHKVSALPQKSKIILLIFEFWNFPKITQVVQIIMDLWSSCKTFQNFARIFLGGVTKIIELHNFKPLQYLLREMQQKFYLYRNPQFSQLLQYIETVFFIGACNL